jgi:hypothetical protein
MDLTRANSEMLSIRLLHRIHSKQSHPQHQRSFSFSLNTVPHAGFAAIQGDMSVLVR